MSEVPSETGLYVLYVRKLWKKSGVQKLHGYILDSNKLEDNAKMFPKYVFCTW